MMGLEEFIDRKKKQGCSIYPIFRDIIIIQNNERSCIIPGLSKKISKIRDKLKRRFNINIAEFNISQLQKAQNLQGEDLWASY